jgi:beta-1,4-galactosyltransferase 1
MDALSFGVKAIERLSKNSQLAYAQAEHIHKEVLKPGGHWTPEECAARQRVAMVVPYRNREDHLRIFVSYMHRFMQAQYLEYQIFVVEQVSWLENVKMLTNSNIQASPDVFNRAALMNIGFLEALKLHDFDCFIFHDVDLLPLDTRQPYTCFQAPTHLGAYMSKFSYQSARFLDRYGLNLNHVSDSQDAL